jgi:hypothetical protein
MMSAMNASSFFIMIVLGKVQYSFFLLIRIKNEPEYKRNDCAKIGFSTYKNIRNASTCCCPMDYEKK